MPRNIQADYQDPADLIWLHAAAALGIRVARSSEVYASWDGKDTLTLSSPAHMDPDDCLAQMIFHELCHLLVSGEQARQLVDWGLDNTSPKDLVYEYATNRLQAALAQGYGLRSFMAVTTVWRSYYDALPRDPLAPGVDSAIELARAGLERARRSPWREVLHAALSATASLAEALRGAVPQDSLWHFTQGQHPIGFRLHADPARRCGDCAWSIERKNGDIECRQTRQGCRPTNYMLIESTQPPARIRLDAAQPACEHHEPTLTRQDCFRCGACCHRGFDVVEVGPKEQFIKRHPDLVEVRSADRRVVPRPGGNCIALAGDGSAEAPYLCRHYEDRPKSCRQFEVGGDACLMARRRASVSTH